MHIPDRDKCNWLRARIETPEKPVYSAEKKVSSPRGPFPLVKSPLSVCLSLTMP